MRKFIGAIVVGMTLVPLFYLAEPQKDLGLMYAAIPIVVAFLISLTAWVLSFKGAKDD